MSWDYGYDWDDRDDDSGGGGGGDHAPDHGSDHGGGGGGGGGSGHSGSGSGSGDAPQYTELRLAAGGGGANPVVVAVSAGGGILASSFLQAVGAKLGERGTQRLTEATGRRWPWRRGRASGEGQPAARASAAATAATEAAAVAAAVQAIVTARPGESETVRVQHDQGVTVVLRRGLPTAALVQYRRLDLSHESLTGTTIVWSADPRHPTGAWRTDSPRAPRRSRYWPERYVWEDGRGHWVTVRESADG